MHVHITGDRLEGGGVGRYLLAGAAGGARGVQFEQEQHQDPQEAGGAQRNHQLGQHGETAVLGHVGQRVGEHVDDPRHHGVHAGRGVVGEAAGLSTQVQQRSPTRSYDVHSRGFCPTR